MTNDELDEKVYQYIKDNSGFVDEIDIYRHFDIQVITACESVGRLKKAHRVDKDRHDESHAFLIAK